MSFEDQSRAPTGSGETHAARFTSQNGPALSGGSSGKGLGNTTGMAGASNPSTGGGERRGETLPQQVGITTGDDFSLRNNMAADYKGGDHTVPNSEASLPGVGGPGSEQSDPSATRTTAGAGGDYVNQQGSVPKHEIDVPGSDLTMSGVKHGAQQINNPYQQNTTDHAK